MGKRPVLERTYERDDDDDDEIRRGNTKMSNITKGQENTSFHQPPQFALVTSAAADSVDADVFFSLFGRTCLKGRYDGREIMIIVNIEPMYYIKGEMRKIMIIINIEPIYYINGDIKQPILKKKIQNRLCILLSLNKAGV